MKKGDNMEKKIDNNMNLLRTIAVIMVVLLHVNASNMQGVANGTVDVFSSTIIMTISVITRIAVALFVLISGRYVIKSLDNMSIKEFYKRRVPRLVIPLLAWSIFYFIICLIGIKGTTIITFAKDFATGFAFNMMVIHLWYLYMLLGLYLITPILYNILKNSSLKKGMIIAVSLCIFGSIVEIIKVVSGTNIWIFWWLEFMGLFSMGYMLKEYKAKKKFNFLIGAVVIEIIATILSILLITRGNKIGMMFHGGVVLNTQLTAIFVYIFMNSCEVKDNLLSKWSKYSFGIYLIHPVFIVTILMSWSTGIIVIDIVIKTVLAYIISLGVIMGLSKIKILKSILQ